MATLASEPLTTTSSLDTTHRKIELQSHQDIIHLLSQTRLATRSKIDLAFPPSANGSHLQEAPSTSSSNPQGDALRRRVEELLEEYVREVYKGVMANLLVNGMDVDPEGGRLGSQKGEDGKEEEREEYEPLDTKLVEKLRLAEQEKERLTETVADLRRTAPQTVSAAYKRNLAAEQILLDVEAEGFDGQFMVEESAGGAGGLLGEEGLERGDEMEKRWRGAMSSLLALKAGLPETVGLLERAREIGEFMESREKR